jgi:hypothetical protein
MSEEFALEKSLPSKANNAILLQFPTRHLGVIMVRAIILCATFLAPHAIAENRHAGAHVHGVNHVKLVLSDSSLQISYEFPVVQLAKHDEHKHDEHKHDEHKHDEQAKRLEEINSITTLVAIPDAADCSQSDIRQELRAVASTGSDEAHADHQDVIIEAVLTCQNPSALNTMDFSPAFNHFDDVEKIEVEGILGAQPISETLTARKAVISF